MSEETPGRATTARRAAVSLPDHLPARMLNELVYCPRLFYYEWVEGVFAPSVDTVEGSIRHARVDAREDALPPPSAEETIHARSVTLSSDTYGLIAKIDLVEGEGGLVSPVDYKKGRPREGEEGAEAWPSDRVQVCAQALILRDCGYACDEAVLYYHETRQRVRVPIDEVLVAETLAAARRARDVAASGRIPPPLVDSPKCPRCSLVSICLPDETSLCERVPAVEPDPQLSLFDEHGEPTVAGTVPALDGDPVRRLVPARDDLRPLYVTGHGLTVGKSGGLLQVRDRGKMVQEVRIGEISQVNLFGSVQLTAAAVHGLCEAEKPIAHFSTGGWFYGLTQGLGLKNVFLRRDQFEKAGIEYFGAHVAAAIVASKIANQRTLLQRNHVEPPPATLRRLKELAERAAGCRERESLLGVEGTAARLYFESLGGMIKAGEEGTEAGVDEPRKPEGGETWSFEFDGRNRRPPRDPVNALLSFAYSLLVKDLTIICAAIGFDPFIGFYHQPRFGRPALALDLMEGFRPLVADSAVLTAINTRMVQPRHFLRVGPSVALTPPGRKGLLRAYEQRMDALVTHPLFGYRVNYRRILEIQARLLARVVTGELARYPGFETR